MNKIIIVSLVVVIASAWARPADDLEDFDRINVDEVFESERLINSYINCAKTGKKCPPEGKKLRELIPSALNEKCAKCSETQKEKMFKILEWIIQNKPQDFLEIEEIHDKNHQYRVDYAETLKSRNIVLPPLK